MQYAIQEKKKNSANECTENKMVTVKWTVHFTLFMTVCV